MSDNINYVIIISIFSERGKAQPVIQLQQILPRPKKRKAEDLRTSPRGKKPSLPVKKTKVPGALKPPEDDIEVTQVTPPKRGRGRPKKSVTPPAIKTEPANIKLEPQDTDLTKIKNEAVDIKDIKEMNLEVEEIPKDKIVPVLALLDIENEILQEMTDVPENLRTVYYFEQRFEVKAWPVFRNL